MLSFASNARKQSSWCCYSFIFSFFFFFFNWHQLHRYKYIWMVLFIIMETRNLNETTFIMNNFDSLTHAHIHSIKYWILSINEHHHKTRFLVWIDKVCDCCNGLFYVALDSHMACLWIRKSVRERERKRKRARAKNWTFRDKDIYHGQPTNDADVDLLSFMWCYMRIN